MLALFKKSLYVSQTPISKCILTTSAVEPLGSCKIIGRLLRKPISPFAMAGVTNKEIFLIFPNLGLTGGIGGNMFTNTTASNYKTQAKTRDRIVIKLLVKKKYQHDMST